MDIELKDRFLTLWEKYFDGTELPIFFYYTNGIYIQVVDTRFLKMYQMEMSDNNI
jgi:hypothetical protein